MVSAQIISGIICALSGIIVVQGEITAPSAVSSSPCVANAVESGRNLYAAQEAFFKCYKDCTKNIHTGSANFAPTLPDFTANFASLAILGGMSSCSKLCTEKVGGDFITSATIAAPLTAFDKIAKVLSTCAADEKNDGDFAADLATFTLQNLNAEKEFMDPKKRRLFSVFYPDHLQTFWAGMTQYDRSSKNCVDILKTMSAALAAYTTNLNFCHHWCLISLSGPVSNFAGQQADLFSVLTSVSRCQHSCYFLFRYNSSPTKSLLHPASEIFHYLQYCLWHTGNIAESYKLASSYSILEPYDTSLYDYYVGGGKVTESQFQPTPEAVFMKDQLNALTKVLKIGDDVKSGISAGAPAVIGQVLQSLKAYESANESDQKEAEMGTCDAASGLCSKVGGARVVANFTGIDNTRRYVVDDMMATSQCEKLVQLNLRAGKTGDGYMVTKEGGSPYTDYETYIGLAAHRLAEMAADGIVLPEEVLLFFSVTDAALQKTKQLFGLKELYFYYVHLVCREAVKAKGEFAPSRNPSKDPSHPIHADNCAIQENGDCLYTDPLLTPRNYSAVLYLNDDFVGGEFFFAHRPNKTEDKKINPRCGRMVTFHAGEFHGVRAVTQGTRCALAIWFTMDKDKEEQARFEAFRVVSQLAELRASVPPEPIGPDVVGRSH